VPLPRSYLEELSRKLAEAGIPHSTAVGTLEDGGAIMQAAEAAGIADFEEHLWLGSFLETFYLFRHERKVRGDLQAAESPENIAEVIERLATLHLVCSHDLPMRRKYSVALQPLPVCAKDRAR
jgi:hypothetical protein